MNDLNITPYVEKLAVLLNKSNYIAPEVYKKYDIQRGLRDIEGNSTVAGLTKISRIKSKSKDTNGNNVPCEGQLFYRGRNIRDIVKNLFNDDISRFEETIYLILLSTLPDKNEFKKFCKQLSEYRNLDFSFFETIFKTPNTNVMNMLARSVLTLYTYDKNPDDISDANVLDQCLRLIAIFPLIVVYSYKSSQNYVNGKKIVINHLKQGLNTAETFLYLLREGGEYSPLEAKLLDLMLVLHAEHGGGNNSTFTTRIVSSSGTDTYSAISAALGSLKGPRHGGASIKVVQMFDDMKNKINTKDKSEIRDYLEKLLDKQAFDKAGLIYGMGHALYSISDPRTEILRVYAKKLSEEKGLQDDFELYEIVEKIAPEIINKKRKMCKKVSANVDFYSGMIYKMLGIPYELFTPIFAMARVVGWSAHRIEEIRNSCKIIRPTYINVQEEAKYIELHNR